MSEQIDISNAVRPSLWRRLAAIFYDSWLIAALWLLGATIDYFIQTALGLQPSGSQLPLQIYLAACPFVFFGWFWTHGGQTLGMRAWRLKLLDEHGTPVSWQQSMRRVAGAYLSAFALGLGYLWILFSSERSAWHDKLSATRLVLLEKD